LRSVVGAKEPKPGEILEKVTPLCHDPGDRNTAPIDARFRIDEQL
jgi:hypothetical protein